MTLPIGQDKPLDKQKPIVSTDFVKSLKSTFSATAELKILAPSK